MNFKKNLFSNNKKLLFLFLIFLFLLASISVLHAFKIANSYGSGDFQYSPTVLFLEKINPYEIFMSGNFDNKIMLAQYPFYSHVTYVVLAPFGFLEWEIARLIWSILNIITALYCAILVSQFCKLKVFETIIICLIFFCSTPFRNCISNGNVTYFVLLCYFAVMINRENLKNFILGFAYFKYNFMPILAFFILFRSGIKGLLISSIFCIIGWLIFSFYLNQNPIDNLFQPIQSAFSGGFDQTLSRGDLFTILGFLKNFELEFNLNLFRIIIVLIASFFLAKDISKINNKMLILNLLLIGNLLTFGHLIYDYIVLLPSFVYSYSNRKLIQAKISLFIILYFWFGIRLIGYFIDYMKKGTFMMSPVSFPTSAEVFINFALLIILYYSIKKINQIN
tara:strand:+ start:415 stop:1593 length:1179 start_codon:yes stop_codon:yes gene_type:complete